MYAVIETGGKQYQVSPGDKLNIELLEEREGEVTFDKVLLVKTDEAVKIGTPHVKGATVTAEIVKAFKGPKILIFKKKKRKQYRRTRGHRQGLLQVLIKDIQGA
jgi:large subunit ribosomal protein L21